MCCFKRFDAPAGIAIWFAMACTLLFAWVGNLDVTLAAALLLTPYLGAIIGTAVGVCSAYRIRLAWPRPQ